MVERSGFKPWPGLLYCVVVKILDFHSTSLHPGVNGTGELSGQPEKMLGVTCDELSPHQRGNDTLSRFML